MCIDIACGIKEDETGGKARLKTMTVPSASPTTPNRPALTRNRGLVLISKGVRPRSHRAFLSRATQLAALLCQSSRYVGRR